MLSAVTGENPLLFILLTGFGVVAVTAFATLIAQRLRIAPSLVLVFAGAVLAFTPGVPKITLDAQLVLLLLLPPLLYNSGVGMSWRGFRANLAPIMMLAIGCVIFTAAVVATAAHWLLGLSWPVGFVLGALVSPPDAVAPMAIARRLGIPQQLLVILEGEGLVNDATALILFSFGLAAVAEAHFSAVSALVTFALVVVGELAWGIFVGWALLWIRRWAKNPEVEMVLALLTPYLAFWVPHTSGGSGVLAAVACGLYVSWNGRRFIPAATRLQGFFVWGLLVHVIEGVVFALTGLQAHIVTEGLDDQGWRRLAFASVLMTVVVVVVRFIWVIPATFIPGWLFPKYRAKGQPPWQYAFLIGFTGIRGVVSMAAALSIPVYVGSELFPERSLLICVTFFVIMASLFGMGTSLPFVIRLLGLSEIGAAEAADAKRTEIAARISGIDAVLARLKELEEVAAAAPILLELRRRHELRRRRYVAAFDGDLSPEQIAGEAALELEVVEAERANLAELYNNAAISDEARRRVERELDIEDALVRHAAQSASSGMPDALG